MSYVEKKASFSSFKEFYPYYLQEHKNKVCRRLHVLASLIVLGILFSGLATQNYHWLWFMPLAGYGLAWIGHFFFEKNKPATFKHPFYSFLGDWVMLKDVLTRKIPW